MLVATIAIAGIPPFAGFFSKDEILHHAFASGHYGVWAAGVVGAFLTAFYMFRLYILAFRGQSRLSHEAEHHLHESPPVMIAPLVVLAGLSIVGGWIGMPMQEGGHALQRWLAPSLAPVATAVHGAAHGAGHAAAHEVSRTTEWILMLLSVGVALAGIVTAFRMYLQQPSLATSLQERFAGVHRTLLNKYWVDELYDATVVRFTMGISNLFWKLVDTKIVDGIVNGVGYTLEGASAVLRWAQTGFVGTYALLFAAGVVALLLHFLVRN
jgi:NADH-quinone oxidoreductase subunit L